MSSQNHRRVTTCARCDQQRRHEGRGLCRNCYTTCNRNDTLLDWPRLSWSREDVLEEWVVLRRGGCTVREAALRLDMSLAALYRAIQRARAAGVTV